MPVVCVSMAVGTFACRGEGRGPHAEVTARPDPLASALPSPSPSQSPPPKPTLTELQCLPANVCDKWAGCALVGKDAAGHWQIASADALAPGDYVNVRSVCTNGSTCVAAQGVPKGVVCPPWTAVPMIAPAGYACVSDAAGCHKT
jgi:hypothetical protein